jgi:hypothetical protein
MYKSSLSNVLSVIAVLMRRLGCCSRSASAAVVVGCFASRKNSTKSSPKWGRSTRGPGSKHHGMTGHCQTLIPSTTSRPLAAVWYCTPLSVNQLHTRRMQKGTALHLGTTYNARRRQVTTGKAYVYRLAARLLHRSILGKACSKVRTPHLSNFQGGIWSG